MLLEKELGDSHHRSHHLGMFLRDQPQEDFKLFNTLHLRECSSLADDPTEDLLCVLEDQCIPKKGALSGQDIFNQ